MNEEKNIGHVLSRLPDDLHEVILVDGNSRTTRSRRPAAPIPAIRVLTQSGRGKGDAFRTGFAAVTGNLVVMLDADGSADPAEIPRFVEALEAGADFAKGSRFLEGGGSADITPTAQPRQHLSSAAPPTSCTAPTSPTSATATTPSGPAACPSSRSTSPASRSRP